MKHAKLLSAFTLVLCLAGCWGRMGTQSQVINPESGGRADAPARTDDTGALRVGALRVVAPAAPIKVTVPDAQPSDAQPPAPGIPSGQSLSAGGIVAEVNSRPIYAGQLIRLQSVQLAAIAKNATPEQFRRAATDLINRQRQELINDELTFAAAERKLSDEDKLIADMLTMQWRARQVTDAGGSIEVARRRALADGYDFDELVKLQYRRFMVMVFRQRKVVPLIQVSATEIRSYYLRNLDREFTEHEQARFRVIKADPAAGQQGRDKALEKIRGIYLRAAAGEDFAVLAATSNDDPGLARLAGDVGMIPRGSFALKEVENAVWAIQPGQVTNPIDTQGGFYIAKLEAVKQGSVLAFDDPAVQKKIYDQLWSEQYAAYNATARARLAETAIIRADPAMLQPAIDLAMQEYPRWAKQ